MQEPAGCSGYSAILPRPPPSPPLLSAPACLYARFLPRRAATDLNPTRQQCRWLVAFARALKAQLTEDSDLRAELEVGCLMGSTHLHLLFALALLFTLPRALYRLLVHRSATVLVNTLRSALCTPDAGHPHPN